MYFQLSPERNWNLVKLSVFFIWGFFPRAKPPSPPFFHKFFFFFLPRGLKKKFLVAPFFLVSIFFNQKKNSSKKTSYLFFPSPKNFPFFRVFPPGVNNLPVLIGNQSPPKNNLRTPLTRKILRLVAPRHPGAPQIWPLSGKTTFYRSGNSLSQKRGPHFFIFMRKGMVKRKKREIFQRGALLFFWVSVKNNFY